MDNLIFNMERMDDTPLSSRSDDKIVITITDKGDNHKGILYFERVKVGFNRKPISMNSWACVDAKTEGLYEMGGDYTSLDILNECQRLISSFIPSGN
jgi:hypothetical protein